MKSPCLEVRFAVKLLLHACCGPCSLEPVRLLRETGHDITIHYANSNIHPAEEYAHRLQTLRSWAAGGGIDVLEGAYDPDRWEAAAGKIGNAALAACGGRVLEQDPARREARCRACYRLRLEETAQLAAQAGFEGIGTTLSVSPYQYTEVIREEVERAAAAAGAAPVFEDFRPYYDEATRRSRELGMYRQNFCGCRISEKEAAAEREQRKAQRAAAKAAERARHAAEHAAEAAALARRKAERAEYDKKQARKRAVLKALRKQGKS